MLIGDLLKVIEKVLPPETAMEGDRLGLQLQSGIRDVRNIIVTMELTSDVVGLAKAQKADCIITFHPLIFRPVLSITDDERVGSILTQLIKNSIALISIHTNYDAFGKGTSYLLAEKLGLNVEGFLLPDTRFDGYGMGVTAAPSSNLSIQELMERLSEVCGSPLRYCKGRDMENINKIALVGGSGSSFLDEAIESEADCFITADITYHTFHRAAGKIWLLDPGHYEMEQFVAQGLAELLTGVLSHSDINSISIAGALTNPVLYYPNAEFYRKKQEEYMFSITNKWCNFNGAFNLQSGKISGDRPKS